MAHGGVAERPAVTFQRLRVVDVAALGHASQGVVEEVLRIGADQALRQVVRLGEEEPVIGVEGEGLVHRAQLSRIGTTVSETKAATACGWSSARR